jgi:hypothetical protein
MGARPAKGGPKGRRPLGRGRADRTRLNRADDQLGVGRTRDDVELHGIAYEQGGKAPQLAIYAEGEAVSLFNMFAALRRTSFSDASTSSLSPSDGIVWTAILSDEKRNTIITTLIRRLAI